LLVVHHDTRDWAAADHDAQNHDTQTHDTHGHGEHIDPDDWVQPPDVARLLGPEWTIEVDELRARTISGGAGAGHSHDVVLRARRGGRRQS
jgi:hypothetical protein